MSVQLKKALCLRLPPHPLAETGVHLKTGIHVSRRTSTRLGEALRAGVGTRETAGGRPEHTQAHRSLFYFTHEVPVEVKEPSAKNSGLFFYHRRRQGKFNTTHKQPQLVRTSTKDKKKKGGGRGSIEEKKILAASFLIP